MRFWPTRSSAGPRARWLAERVEPVCNLYSLNKKRDMIARMFRISHNRAEAFDPLSAIFPGHVAPVVRQRDDGERDLVLMHWGFMLLMDGRAPRRVTNVREDKILSSRFWRGSFDARRCLVPASSFCEPNSKVKPATWHSHVWGQAQTSR